MKLPSTHRSLASGVALAALCAWSVPTIPLQAQDDPGPAAATDPAAAAADTPVEATGPAVEAPAIPPAAAPRVPAAPEPVRLHDLVTIMNSAHLRAGEITPEMVTVMGDAVVDGVVEGQSVTVLGSVTVNGRVRGDLVCVGGTITLGPGAEVRGQVVSVGGGLVADPTSRIHGDKVAIHLPGFGGFGGWTAEWFRDGLAKARVLPHNHSWAWSIAVVVVLLNMLFAALFSGAVTATARAVEARPVLACVNGALTLLLAPVLFILLAASVIGIPLLPIAVAGLFLCWFIGTIGIYVLCGQQFGIVGRPVVAALAGNLVFLLLYALPVIGFAVWSVTAVMGLGAAVTAMSNRRRETREARLAARSQQTPPAPGAPTAPVPPVAAAAVASPVHAEPPPHVPSAAMPAPASPPPTASAGFAGTSAAAGGVGATAVPPYSGWTPPPPPPTVPPLPIEVLTERATFLPRLLAFVLDLLVVTVAINILGLGAFPVWVLAMIGYHVFFWGWRSTTPAGIVLNLQIVRDDGTPMDYRVAAVRALSGVFSLVPAGLGLIWMAFDRDCQAWHDKLAGTSVIVVRKPRPLI